METHKPFLNPEITLELLANEISVNPRMLSQIINETFKKNFKSFILEYRIRESMQILADCGSNNRFSRAARARAATFDYATIIPQYERVYEQALQS